MDCQEKPLGARENPCFSATLSMLDQLPRHRAPHRAWCCLLLPHAQGIQRNHVGSYPSVDPEQSIKKIRCGTHPEGLAKTFPASGWVSILLLHADRRFFRPRLERSSSNIYIGRRQHSAECVIDVAGFPTTIYWCKSSDQSS